jgi:hypothetical protein
VVMWSPSPLLVVHQMALVQGFAVLVALLVVEAGSRLESPAGPSTSDGSTGR